MNRWFIHACYTITKLSLYVFFRLGFGLRVTGLEHIPKRGAFLMAGNHISYLDPPLVGACCPRYMSFMARSTLYDHFWMKAFLRAMGAIPLKRGEGDLHAIRSAIAKLKLGEPVAIFPEGHRQGTGAIGEAKRGIGLLALSAQIPIIPVYVEGTYEALPPTSTKLRFSKIRVAFGPAISYTNVPVDVKDGHRLDKYSQQVLADQVTAAWRQMSGMSA
ncbi:MAG: 1-acyl-sn-glycerol-3-phosphate acyltransferase [Candidatus Omnitrophica bacterium]|nr:1-acyl-sn-glycerol-3-phosphate acyltransferase [Candidatus Omnitrophota bacterium]MBI3009685.1 1-acyl-sn-glycerol-3-phosphate acyltransferase [Candidatus Omnitrophota bacterium]